MTSTRAFAKTSSNSALRFAPRSQFLGVAVAALLTVATTACQPNDEKVSSRGGGGFNSASGETDAKLGDRVTEYSRSMLIEVADVARQAEFLLQASDLQQASALTATGAVGTVAPQALEIPKCAETKLDLVADPNVVQFVTVINGCSEKGPTFDGKQFGRETATATLRKVDGQPTVATSLKVVGAAIDTVLTPKANPKDSLRVETNRIFSASLESETATTLTYAFSYLNESPYNLNLKALTDGGKITSEIKGSLVYDIATKKVTMIRDGKMAITVESARLGRNGGRLVRQEFAADGVVGGASKALAMDLASCSLPQGSVEMQFTVRPVLAREKDKVVDSSTIIDSFKDHVVNTKSEPAPSTSKVDAKLCSSAGAITMTEFYAGLLY